MQRVIALGLEALASASAEEFGAPARRRGTIATTRFSAVMASGDAHRTEAQFAGMQQFATKSSSYFHNTDTAIS
jgi:hypothetical protein